MALRVACAALVLAAGGCRARPEVQHPEPHRFLQQTTSGCDFSTSNLGFNPDVASDIYSSSLGFMLASGPGKRCPGEESRDPRVDGDLQQASQCGSAELAPVDAGRGDAGRGGRRIAFDRAAARPARTGPC